MRVSATSSGLSSYVHPRVVLVTGGAWAVSVVEHGVVAVVGERRRGRADGQQGQQFVEC